MNETFDQSDLTFKVPFAQLSREHQATVYTNFLIVVTERYLNQDFKTTKQMFCSLEKGPKEQKSFVSKTLSKILKLKLQQHQDYYNDLFANSFKLDFKKYKQNFNELIQQYPTVSASHIIEVFNQTRPEDIFDYSALLLFVGKLKVEGCQLGLSKFGLNKELMETQFFECLVTATKALFDVPELFHKKTPNEVHKYLQRFSLERRDVLFEIVGSILSLQKESVRSYYDDTFTVQFFAPFADPHKQFIQRQVQDHPDYMNDHILELLQKEFKILFHRRFVLSYITSVKIAK